MGAPEPLAAGERVHRLSFAQEQLWFLDQLAPDEPTYNVLMAWRLRGPLRVDLLRHAINLVVARHEALRLRIRDDDGTPYQVVAPAVDVPLPVTDLRALPEVERDRRLRDELDAQHTERFVLDTGPLCRFHLLRFADDEYVFCQGYHHIATDGWSAGLLNADLSAAYRALHTGTDPVFGARELDYTEFAETQRERLRDATLDEELAFWRRQLADLPALDLPADRPRPVAAAHRGETLVQDLPADLRQLTQRLGDAHGASLFMTLAAAFALVLGRYTGSEDVPIGVPMLGRPEPELESVVGMFINMVVLRADLSGDPTFAELIDRVAEANLDLYDHQEVPFNQVVDAVAPERDADRNPLFQVSLQLLGDDNDGGRLDFPDVAIEFLPPESSTSRFDVAVSLTDDGSSLRAAVEYSSDLFDRWRMTAMLGHLDTVLRAAAADPSRRLSRIPLVTGAEEEELLRAGRGDDGRQVYVVDRTLNLVPRGVPGELLVHPEPGPAGGERVDNPFPPGGSAYRTGERVRWGADLRMEQQPVEAGPAPAAERDADREDEPATATERSIAEIYRNVLDLPRVGAADSFFAIGGNSLKAMLAVSRIKKAFGVKLGVRTLYGSATVRTVSAEVDERKVGESA